jgi:hypothetical protein
MAHRPFAPSARFRWAHCPGSEQLLESLGLPEEESSEFAAEGSAAHALAAKCIREASECPDPDVQVYLDWLVLQAYNIRLVEQRVEDTKTGITGTPDLVLYGDNGRERTLTVVDYKHGSGVYVHHEDNEQLECYAVAAQATLGLGLVETVRHVIIQPRYTGATPVRTMEYPGDMLEQWRAEIGEEMDRARSPDAPRVPGDWCQFCRATPHCPERRQLVAAVEGLPAASDLTSAQIQWVLKNEKRIIGYLKAVYAEALRRATSGDTSFGYKAVQALGNRVWENEDRARKAFLAAGIPISKYDPREMLSPAQAEALLGKKTVESLSIRPYRGTKLVPESDEIQPSVNVLDVFDKE